MKEMQREIKRRVMVLEYMEKIGVNNYRDVARIISAYYKDPDTLMVDVESVMKR
jgi:flagellar protein FlaI